MGRFRFSGSITTDEVTVVAEELERGSWQDKAEELIRRRENKIRKAERDNRV